MKFLKDKSGQSSVEWLVAAALVVAVVGTIIYMVSSTTATEGTKTNAWINAIPDP